MLLPRIKLHSKKYLLIHSLQSKTSKILKGKVVSLRTGKHPRTWRESVCVWVLLSCWDRRIFSERVQLFHLDLVGNCVSFLCQKLRSVFITMLGFNFTFYNIWDKLFKNRPSKVCGRLSLKNLKWYDPISLQFF